VTGHWRRLQNEELRDLYSSDMVTAIAKRRVIWAGHVARMGKSILGWKSEGKSPPGRPKRRWKVIMDFKGVKWNDLALCGEKFGGFVNMAMEFGFQQCGEFSCRDEELVASQEGLCSTEPVGI